MEKRVYLETTIVSYLTARPSRDVIVLAHQHVTREWWEKRRQDYELYVSQLVVDEAGSGDAEAARLRLGAIAGLPVLAVNDAVSELATELVIEHALPQDAIEDAFHIALASVHGIDFLVTWNCAHIANAERMGAIRATVAAMGYECPVICTPEEMLGESA